MKRLRKFLKDKIKDKSSVSQFAAENDLRQASLYDFFNGNKTIEIDTLFKIIEPLGLLRGLEKDFKLKEVDSLDISGNTIKKGDVYSSQKCLMCFESDGKKALLLESSDKEIHLLIIN